VRQDEHWTIGLGQKRKELKDRGKEKERGDGSSSKGPQGKKLSSIESTILKNGRKKTNRAKFRREKRGRGGETHSKYNETYQEGGKEADPKKVDCLGEQEGGIK